MNVIRELVSKLFQRSAFLRECAVLAIEDEFTRSHVLEALEGNVSLRPLNENHFTKPLSLTELAELDDEYGMYLS